ncbi:MAG: DUF3857 domain-containing protein [Candidatus Aminicenantes bacterium]|nr:DUF3857 domain-containing protein [Candidatus Aminicenantes bacterium]
MKRLTLFCLAFLAVWTLFALPAHDARFLSLEITYTLNADGSWVKDYRHQVRLDTYYAFNRALGETFIVYNPDFQKLEVLNSETTMADGRQVASPQNAFNEVLPFAAHGFADFSHLREMVVTHVGLERGAVVELAYRIHTKAGFLPDFSGREELAMAFPVDLYRLSIKVPADRELHYRVSGLQVEAKVSSDEATKCHAFELANLKPAAHEPLAAEQSGPEIIFSTSVGWEQALALAADPSPLPEIITEKVGKLQAQYPSRPDLLAALQKTVAVEVQNCNLGPEALGWQPRSLERVAQGNYGTRLEKALLLRSMLAEAGIKAEVLAIAYGSAFAADVPAFQQIGEFWLKVSEGPHALYLDPWQEQQEFFPYRLQESTAWNLEKLALEKLPASDRQGSGVDVSGTVQLAADGASGALVVAVRGTFNRYNEASADSNKFIAGLLKKIFPVDKVEVKKLLSLSRREVRVEATFSGKWLKESGSNFFSADAVHLPGLSENLIIKDRRESPLQLDAPFLVSVNLELQPAAGLKLEYFAANVERRNEFGHYARNLVVEKNGRLRFSQSLTVEKALIGPEKYPLLRELLLPYFTPDFWLVFKKSK